MRWPIEQSSSFANKSLPHQTAVLYLLRPRSHSRSTSRPQRLDSQIQRAVQPRLGQISRIGLRVAKKIGLIPRDTKLTPRPPEIPARDSLTADQKRVAERLMETFATYTAQTDYEVGHILDALDEVGQTEHTLIFWELGTTELLLRAVCWAPSMRWSASAA
jgi:hypothetical protein